MSEKIDNLDMDQNSAIIFGRNAVNEAIISGNQIDKIYILSGRRDGSIVKITSDARKIGIPVVEASRKKLDEITRNGTHQGIIALIPAIEYVELNDILDIPRSKGEKAFFVICDSVKDPYNLGAIIRSADAAGAHGIIISKRGSVGITPVVVKASAGAAMHIPVARVTNIATTIERLKKENIWVYALEAGGKPYYKEKFDAPSAFVLGSEGEGVSRLIKEKSDFVISIPMYGRVTSLNVSAAASVILMEAAKHRNETE